MRLRPFLLPEAKRHRALLQGVQHTGLDMLKYFYQLIFDYVGIYFFTAWKIQGVEGLSGHITKGREKTQECEKKSFGATKTQDESPDIQILQPKNINN